MKTSSHENVNIFASWYDFLISVLENSQVASDAVLTDLFCPKDKYLV